MPRHPRIDPLPAASGARPEFPIDAVIPDLKSAFAKHRNVLLSADPGAGKTTRVPIVLLPEPWLNGKKILMLEPRRLAARRSAEFMAARLGERVGETVGYRIRGESAVGKETRLEILTEGILTRMLQSDPALPGVGLVIFDEFHERSIHADLGLAFILDVQEHLRPDLKVLVMSATLDVSAIAPVLEDNAIVTSTGRAFPVTTHYLAQPPLPHIEPVAVSAIRKSIRADQGDILVFLPGQREIRRVAELLTAPARSGALSDNPFTDGSVELRLLYGEAPAKDQLDALRATPEGKRKVILSTNIAETSLTIDGIRVVVDAGLARVSRFDPGRGMSGLVTVPVSRAGADQRRGRAGRQAPGICYRLWTRSQEAEHPPEAVPEILSADLASFALELARWGNPMGDGLRFADRPPDAHLRQARDLLTRLGVLDAAGVVTAHGRAVGELSLHPRLAHMLLKGKDLGAGPAACDVAALLEERDILDGGRAKESDLYSRWAALDSGRHSSQADVARVKAQAARLKQIIGVKDHRTASPPLGLLLALAYPDRIGKRRGEHSDRYQLSGGTGAVLPKGSGLGKEEFLAIAGVDGAGTDVRIFLAEPVSRGELMKAFGDRLQSVDDLRWDEQSGQVVSRRVLRLGSLDLEERQVEPPADRAVQLVVNAIRSMGLAVLPWDEATASLRARSEWLRTAGLAGPDWPDLADGNLLSTLEDWLAPYLGGITRLKHLERLRMGEVLRSVFSHRQWQELERLAPTHLKVPTGSMIPLDYSGGSAPVLAVRLQEMFGQTDTPLVGGGRVKVVIHLLSPARRPLAVTQDLRSFWTSVYPDVRKEMRGRYPKHSWPENPLKAEPTRRTVRRPSR